jgi:anti-sigma B factor antagonist
VSSLVTGLEVIVVAHAAYHVCRPIGELDASTAEMLREAAIALAGTDRVIIDLQDVPFIDSAGLAVVIGAVRRIRDAGGDVAIACERPPLLRLLHTAGLDRLVEVADTVEAAAGPLRGSATDLADGDGSAPPAG